MAETIIRVSHLKKYFKEVKAVDDISFEIKKGELFGFLGINGAGKSTTINMLCTLSAPTDGQAEICGQVLGKENEQIRKRIGVVYQNNCLDDRLSVKENLFVRGSFYEKSKSLAVCTLFHGTANVTAVVMTRLLSKGQLDQTAGQAAAMMAAGGFLLAALYMVLCMKIRREGIWK